MRMLVIRYMGHAPWAKCSKDFAQVQTVNTRWWASTGFAQDTVGLADGAVGDIEVELDPG